MAEKKWHRERSEAGPNLKLFKTRYDYMRNPRNGNIDRMIILESPDSVNIVAETSDEEILFVRQYRFGTGSYTLELPGGLVDPGENHEVAGRRELREETGATSDTWTFLGRIGSNPVFINSYIYHWYAKDVQITDELQLDDSEDVDLVSIPIQECRKRLLSGAFTHPHTVSALLRYFVEVGGIQ